MGNKAAFIAELNDAGLSMLDCTGNASVKMNAAQFLKEIKDALKNHGGVKKLAMRECEVDDAACEELRDIIATNQVIEEVDLSKNKITSAGASALADGLSKNRSITTINLLEQSSKHFGEECLTKFVEMYGTNITLTKLTWRLDSRKSFMLAKLQTRNIEIQKRIANGKGYDELLPDALKGSGSAVPATPEESRKPSV